MISLGEERSHAQVRVHPPDRGGIDRAVGTRRDRPVRDALAGERTGDRRAAQPCVADRGGADGAQIRGDLVGEHFHQAEAEEVRASRLSGRVNTSPPTPAEPLGRPWHAAHESARPAPMIGVVSMSPLPSAMRGPRPCSAVNLR